MREVMTSRSAEILATSRVSDAGEVGVAVSGAVAAGIMPNIPGAAWEGCRVRSDGMAQSHSADSIAAIFICRGVQMAACPRASVFDLIAAGLLAYPRSRAFSPGVLVLCIKTCRLVGNGIFRDRCVRVYSCGHSAGI